MDFSVIVPLAIPIREVQSVLQIELTVGSSSAEFSVSLFTQRKRQREDLEHLEAVLDASCATHIADS